MRIRITRPLAVGVAAFFIVAGGAAAASAAGTPVNDPVSVSATVAQALTVTGVSPTITFTSGNPGDTVGTTASPAESYVVTSNDSAGFSVSISPLAGGLNGPGNGISDTAITVKNTANGVAAAGVPLQNGAPVTIYNTTTAGSGSTSFTDAWSLAIPAGTLPGAYQENFSYVFQGN